MKISKLAFGTAAIGRPLYINIRSQQPAKFKMSQFRADGIKMLNQAYTAGIRYYDTAPGYGISEDLLTNWLDQKNDNEIEVGTKWGYTYTANFDPNASIHEVKEHSLRTLKKQWETSKQLLPHLKTYQIHSATLDTAVLQNDKVLHELTRIKNTYGIKIGLTTTGPEQTTVLKEALKNNLFDVFQVTYNVFDQSLRSFLEDNSISNKKLVIKEALANGRVFHNKTSRQKTMYELLSELSLKHKVGVDAIALQFCAQSIACHTVLSGASTPFELKENLKAIDLTLDENDINRIKEHAIPTKNYWDERKRLNWN